MKITIYELLGLIKEDKAPEKIKYKNKIYFRNWSDYMGDEPIDEYYYDSEQNSWNDELCLKLDDEIEIIEEVEDKEYEDIEEMDGVNGSDLVDLQNNSTLIEQNKAVTNLIMYLNMNVAKINALIRNQKYILGRLDKNE